MFYPAKVSLSVTAKLFPDAVFYRETSQKVIALTIDDTPTPDDSDDSSTYAILDAISDYNQHYVTDTLNKVRATFFVITSHLTQGTAILKRMLDDGHEIGNHGMFDRRHVKLSPPSLFQKEIKEAHDIITQATQTSIHWFRPGGGFYNKDMTKILKEMSGYQSQFALASFPPLDTYEAFMNPKFTCQYITPFIFPGSIFVLHGGTKKRSQNTVQVLKIILPQLQAQGYRIVTFSELLNISSSK